MCNFQKLYFKDDGYIIKCNQCKHYQVAFLSSLLNFSEDDFANFKETLSKRFEEYQHYFDDKIKSVLLHTDSKKSYVLLSVQELAKLIEMFDEADTEAKCLGLLELFNNP